MTWNLQKIDWLDVLAKKRLMRSVVADDTVAALRSAIDKGGFVTGGFARSYAYALLAEEAGVVHPPPSSARGRSDVDGWLALARYLGEGIDVNPTSRRWSQDANTRHMRLWKTNVGDIDVFFTDSQSAGSVIDDLNVRDYTWSSTTAAGFGQEYVFGRRNVLQIITKFTGRPLDVLDSFDISNAQVYFDRDGLHYTDEWVEMETNSQLGINRSDKPNLLWRAHKWVSRHGYNRLRPGDEEKYVDALFNAFERAKSDEWKIWDRKVTTQTISHMGWRFKDWLPPAELLRASLLFDGYRQMHSLQIVAKKMSEI